MSQKRQPPVPPQEDDFLIRTLAMGYSDGCVLPPHRHDWDQLVYATAGVVGVHTDTSSWVVPALRAVWVPAGVEHRVEMTGAVSMRTLYVRAGLVQALPRECCVVDVSPLLRELILHAVELGMLDRRLPAHRRLAGVIVDRLEALETVPLRLPLPVDGRARRVAEALLGNPGSTASLAELARDAGASKRTLERVFHAEVGMSFGRWRQQLRLLHALRLLAAGEPVTGVALDVGYESPSAFIAMFKRTLGTTPGRYYGAR